MRVLLDANILVSYLLQPSPDSSIARVVAEALGPDSTLLLPADLLEELVRKVAQKPYLTSRIPAEDLAALVDILRGFAEPIPRIEAPIPAVTRDPKDDCLLAYSLVGSAAYLVTGDHDLLSLGEVEGVKIVSPAAFLEILRRDPAGRESP